MAAKSCVSRYEGSGTGTVILFAFLSHCKGSPAQVNPWNCCFMTAGIIQSPQLTLPPPVKGDFGGQLTSFISPQGHGWGLESHQSITGHTHHSHTHIFCQSLRMFLVCGSIPPPQHSVWADPGLAGGTAFPIRPWRRMLGQR